MNETVINKSPVKFLGLCVLEIIMLTLCAFDLAGGIKHSNLVCIITGIIALIFFGICFVFIIKIALDKKPLLIISDDGITDMTTAGSKVFIPWSEIKSISVRKVFTQRFIGIDVYDLDKLMSGISPAKQKIITANLRLKYPPISISLNMANKKFSDVLSLIQNKLNEANLKNQQKN
ncbi:MAG: STM3941 family protein [Bacillota bacterium]|nr:STM3941 family protein [Bacillota bacterium]